MSYHAVIFLVKEIKWNNQINNQIQIK